MYKVIILLLVLFIIVSTFICLCCLIKKESDKKQRLKYYIDAVFLTLFFISLCIPCLKINKSEKSVAENRVFASRPYFYGEFNRVNNYFGQDFDNYIKDRFFLRSMFLKIYYHTIGNINDIIYVSDVIYNKKTKIMMQHYKHYSTVFYTDRKSVV